MFEIGATLREARERRHLTYEQVEAEIKIRAKYLRALEEEEFDSLPSGTYVRGFLRAYASYLGSTGGCSSTSTPRASVRGTTTSCSAGGASGR